MLYDMHYSCVLVSISLLPMLLTSPLLNVDSSTSRMLKLSLLPSMNSDIFLIGSTCPIIRSTVYRGTKCNLVSWKIYHRSDNSKIRATYLPHTSTIYGTSFYRSQSLLSPLLPFSAYFTGLILHSVAATFASACGMKMPV